jgi:uncharacterized protein with HEPN domain
VIDRDLVLPKVESLDRRPARIAEVRGEANASILDGELAERMWRMTGLRNVAVHEYRRLAPAVLKAIVRTRLGDLRAFAGLVAGAT